MLYIIAIIMFACEILNIFAFLYKNSTLKQVSKYLFLFGSLGLFAYIFKLKACPLNTLKGSILLFAIFLDILSVFFVLKYRLDSVISIVSPILGIIIILSFFVDKSAFYVPVKHYDFLLRFHIFSSFLAYASLIFSAIASILFLRAHRSLKKKKISQVFKEIPSFPFLEKAIDHATAFGLIFTSFTILTGFILLEIYYQTIFIWDIKIIGFILLYVLYVIFFILRFVKNINIVTWAKYNIIAALFLFTLFLIGNTFIPGIHNFSWN